MRCSETLSLRGFRVHLQAEDTVTVFLLSPSRSPGTMNSCQNFSSSVIRENEILYPALHREAWILVRRCLTALPRTTKSKPRQNEYQKTSYRGHGKTLNIHRYPHPLMLTSMGMLPTTWL